MPNTYTGEVSLKIGEKEFSLRCTFLTIAELEEKGINAFEEGALTPIKAQLTLFFELVKGQHGVNTLQDADNLLMEDYQACSDAAGEAITLFFQNLSPKGEKEKESA